MCQNFGPGNITGNWFNKVRFEYDFEICTVQFASRIEWEAEQQMKITVRYNWCKCSLRNDELSPECIPNSTMFENLQVGIPPFVNAERGRCCQVCRYQAWQKAVVSVVSILSTNWQRC